MTKTTTTATVRHTPGPWKLGGYKDREIKVPEFHNNCNPLARVYARLGEMDANGCHTWRDDEAKANALLIAAAPDLLKACKKDAERIAHLCRMVNDFAGKLGLGRKVRTEDWDDEARAAIAKATSPN